MRRIPSTHTTRAETREILARNGISGPAAEAYLAATGPDRHAARVARFIEKALAEYLRRTSRAGRIPSSCQVEAYTYAIAVLVLDAFGVVAPHGPTEATTKIHHRAFRDGCGPRIGPRAVVTHAAARGAVDELYRAASLAAAYPMDASTTTLREIALSPVASPPGIAFDLPGLPSLVLAANRTDAQVDVQPASWLRTLALEGMRRALGEAPWFELGAERRPGADETTVSPSIFDLVVFMGGADAWAAVLAAALP